MAALVLVAMTLTQVKSVVENVTDQIQATVTATAVSDHEIRLDMSATSTIGPVDHFVIYRDGVYLDTVYVQPPKPAPPTSLGVK